MLNSFTPPSVPAAAKVPPEPEKSPQLPAAPLVTPPLSWGERWRIARAKRRFRRLLRRVRRELKRNHEIKWEVFALALLADVVISAGIIYSAWENAEKFSASDHYARNFMLLAPVLGVIFEMAKAPVGLLSQIHPSPKKRAGALLGIALAAAFTTINAVPIFARVWKPQLAIVQQATTNLAVAKANQASFDNDRQAAKDAADQAQADYKEAQETRRTASKRDTHAKGTITELASARNDVAQREKKLNSANKKLAGYDAKKTDDAVRDDDAALRKARQDSTLHWIYASATGAEISSVTDKQLAPVMIGAIGLPSVLVASLSSLLSILCVWSIPQPKRRDAPEAKPEPVLVVDEPVFKTWAHYQTTEAEKQAAKEAEAKRRRADAKTQKAFAKIVEADTTAKRVSKPKASSRKPRPSPRAASNDNAADETNANHLQQKEPAE